MLIDFYKISHLCSLDPFRGDVFDLEKHLPDELDLLPSTSTWPSLDPPSAPSQPNMLITNSQNQLNQQVPKFQMNGEATPQSPSLMQVSLFPEPLFLGDIE